MIEGRSTGLSRSNGRDRRRDLAVMAALGLALALAGGASRYDEWQQTAVRLAAIAAIAIWLWSPGVRGERGPLMALAGLYLLPILQLVPLPPDAWAALPGHGVYARIAQESGQAVWRPLSVTPDLTVNALLALLPPTAAAFGVTRLDGHGRLMVARGVVGIAAFSALLGLAQLGAGGAALHLYRQSNDDAPIGLFANRNHPAVLLACTLPFVGVLVARALQSGRDPRLVAGMAMGFVTLAVSTLALTGSRMGLLLAPVGLAGAAICLRAGGGRFPPTRRSTSIVAAASLLVAGAAAWQSGAIERLVVTDSANESRISSLPSLIATARAFQPLGAGFGSFDPAYRRFEPDALLSTVYLNQAHDEPVQLTIEGGVPALLLLLLFLAWWGRSAARIVKGAGPRRRRAMGLAASTATLILMMSSLVDYPLRTPMLGALFLICCIEMMRAAEVEPDSARD